MKARTSFPKDFLWIQFSDYINVPNTDIVSVSFHGVAQRKLTDIPSCMKFFKSGKLYMTVGVVPFDTIDGDVSLEITTNDWYKSIDGISFEATNNTLSSTNEALYSDDATLPTCIECGTSSKELFYLMHKEYSDEVCENCFAGEYKINVTDIKQQYFVEDCPNERGYYTSGSVLEYTITYETENNQPFPDIFGIHTPDLIDSPILPWFEGTVTTTDSRFSGVLTPFVNRSRRSFEVTQDETLTETIIVDILDDFALLGAELVAPSVESDILTYEIQCNPQIKTSQILLDL